MKRARFVVLGALAVATIGVSFEVAPAHAGDVSVPVECIVPDLFTTVELAETTPGCENIDGLCLVAAANGPSRAVHPQGAVINPNDNCDSFDDRCVVHVVQPPVPGPSRSVHGGSPSRVVSSTTNYEPGAKFPIDPFCLDLPETGADIAPLLIAAIAAIGAGVVLLDIRRRLRPNVA